MKVNSDYNVSTQIADRYILAWAEEKGMVSANFAPIHPPSQPFYSEPSSQLLTEPPNRPSSLKCKFIRIALSMWRLISFCSHYKGAAENAQPLAFVGKGITFDSGGISLKPGAVEYILLSKRASRSTIHFDRG